MELIAETDDEILDKYFSGEELDEQDIQKGLTIGIQRWRYYTCNMWFHDKQYRYNRNIRYNNYLFTT